MNARYLLTDSRQLTFPEASAFFAIRGLHHDGHRYIQELYRKGVREFVIDDPAFDSSPFAEATFYRVADTLAALQATAAAHRQAFSIPVIGITGSNGKTMVKEWLTQVLSPDFVVCRSPKSYNSQLGVPLSVWGLQPQHTVGIFEAGISRPGEMPALEAIIRPTIGILTNVGSAHDEAFACREEKIREKLSLFRSVETFICCEDDAGVMALLPDFLPPTCKLVGWKRHEADALPFADAASRENAMHVLAAARQLGLPDGLILDRLAHLRPVSMRLELREAINGCYVIDDSYNNDLAGLKIALDFLANHHERPHKVLILSDILQSGLEEHVLYAQLSELLQGKGVQQLIGIGPALSRHQMAFRIPATFYASTDDFLQQLRTSAFRDSVVLVKGARSFGFEQIVGRLVSRTHGTVLEVNLDALSHNLNYFREKVGQTTRLMVMVKAFAYGSGIEEVANLLQFHRVDYLAVAYPDEGVRLRRAGVRLPIMVMNVSEDGFRQLIDAELEPEIFSPRILRQWLDFLQRLPTPPTPERPARIHLKFDTGMHRLGFEEAHLGELCHTLQQHPEVRVATMFSHLAAADEARHDAFTRGQIARFARMTAAVTAVLPYGPLRHLCNSPGLARFPEARFDMVRLGKGLYGTAVLAEDQQQLRTVGTLKTIISQLKTVPATETVGYGRQGLLSRSTRIATIAIGYADGYDRKFSRGVGKVLIHGQLCPVVGNVCMDMTMVDVTELPHCEEGDEVIVFGDSPSIRELAAWSGTIPYEILTNVGERVRRVFYREGN